MADAAAPDGGALSWVGPEQRWLLSSYRDGGLWAWHRADSGSEMTDEPVRIRSFAGECTHITTTPDQRAVAACTEAADGGRGRIVVWQATAAGNVGQAFGDAYGVVHWKPIEIAGIPMTVIVVVALVGINTLSGVHGFVTGLAAGQMTTPDQTPQACFLLATLLVQLLINGTVPPRAAPDPSDHTGRMPAGLMQRAGLLGPTTAPES